MGIIEKMRLDGKKGFVTGGARGIGKCTATAFAEAGADVAIVDIDFEEAQKTAREIAEKTGEIWGRLFRLPPLTGGGGVGIILQN